MSEAKPFKTSVNLSTEDRDWLMAHPEYNLTGLVHKCIAGEILTLSDEDRAWLKDHPDVSLSGLVHKCISEMRARLDP